MKRKPSAPAVSATLRRRGETRVRGAKSGEGNPRAEADTQRLLRELQVHQVELRRANEAFRAEIAERQRTEEALRKSEARYRAVLEDQTEIIGRYTPDGVFTFVNEVFCRFFGKTSQELLGHPWQPQAVTEDLPLIKAKLGSLSPANPVVVIENRVYSGTGEVRWMQFVNRGFFDSSGRLVETQAVGRDITERQQAEERLERLNLRMSLAARAGRLGIWDWDIPKNEVIWDDRMYQLYGVTRQGFNGSYEAWLQTLHPEDRARCDEFSRETLRSGTDYETEFRVIWPDGSVHHLKAYGYYVRAEDGTLLRLTGINYDITERKQAEEWLRTKEEDLARAQAVAHLGSWSWDSVHDIISWSDEMFRIYGVDPKDFVPRRATLARFTHPDDHALRDQALAKAIRGQRVEPYEMRVVRPDGTERVVLVIGVEALRDAEGRPLRVFGTALDITERKQAERALRESEKRFATIFRASPVAIGISRLSDGKFLDVNDAFVRLYGYTRDEVVGHTSEELRLWHTSNRAEVTRQLTEAKHLLMVDMQGRRESGEICDLLASIELVELGGEPCIVGMLADITERKRALADLAASQKALRALAARLEAVREQERQTLARDIHDTFGHALTDWKFDLAWLGRRLAEAGLSGRTAVRRKITAMSQRAEAEMQSVRRMAGALRPALLDTLGLVSALQALVRDFQARTRIRCRLELPPAPPTLDVARSTALFRIAQELLTNVARHAQATVVEIRLTASPEAVELRVHDNGRGLPAGAESGPAAFGLLGMRERASGLGGELTLRGVPNQGTTATVRLPAGAPSATD